MQYINYLFYWNVSLSYELLQARDKRWMGISLRSSRQMRYTTICRPRQPTSARTGSKPFRASQRQENNCIRSIPWPGEPQTLSLKTHRVNVEDLCEDVFCLLFSIFKKKKFQFVVSSHSASCEKSCDTMSQVKQTSSRWVRDRMWANVLFDQKLIVNGIDPPIQNCQHDGGNLQCSAFSCFHVKHFLFLFLSRSRYRDVSVWWWGGVTRNALLCLLFWYI